MQDGCFLVAGRSQKAAVFVGAHIGQLFTNLGNIRRIGISDHFSDVSDPETGMAKTSARPDGE